MRRICLLIFLVSIFFLQCDDIARNNPFDPANPNSSVDRIVLAELFINDDTGYEYCDYAVEALNNLKNVNEYKDEFFILEYHLDNAGWNDEYARAEFNQRYYDYVPQSSNRGIPDAMFNGLVERVQGASIENIQSRYEIVLDELIGDKSHFGIETSSSISGNTINIDVKVIRYGGTDKNDVYLYAVLYEDMGTMNCHHVVKKILPRQIIENIKHGTDKDFSFSSDLSSFENINNVNVLIFLQDQSNNLKEIYQVTKI